MSNFRRTVAIKKIEYHSAGDAANETLVLLHPGGTLHSIWLPLIRHWCNHYHIIAFDIYPSDADQAASTVTRILKSVGIQKFHLLGSSLGGNIALQIALLSPESVASLILDSAQAGSSRPSPVISAFLNLLELIMRLTPFTVIEHFMLRQFKHLTEHDQIAVREELKKMGKLAFVRHAKATLRHNVASRLHEIRIPTLILAGGKDMLTTSGEPQKLHTDINGACLEMIPAAGHVTFLTHPDDFLVRVDSFLEKLT